MLLNRPPTANDVTECADVTHSDGQRTERGEMNDVRGFMLIEDPFGLLRVTAEVKLERHG
jgi:hypothetical protein